MRRFLGAVTALVALTCSACVPSGLAFRADERLKVIAPADEAEVTLPVTLRWRIKDFDVVDPGTPVREGAGYFAVFVDRPPMPPGKDLAWLVRKEPACDRSKGCPDAKLLAKFDVYTTTSTELLLAGIEEPTDDEFDRHRATIVLVDGGGRRIGESAVYVDFEVRRGAQS